MPKDCAQFLNDHFHCQILCQLRTLPFPEAYHFRECLVHNFDAVLPVFGIGSSMHVTRSGPDLP